MAGTLRLLTRADLESLNLSMAEVVAAVEAGCRAKGEGDVLMPLKRSLHGACAASVATPPPTCRLAEARVSEPGSP